MTAGDECAMKTVAVKFKRCRHLPGREGPQKDVIDLHYGEYRIQHFWILSPRQQVRLWVAFCLRSSSSNVLSDHIENQVFISRYQKLTSRY